MKIRKLSFIHIFVFLFLGFNSFSQKKDFAYARKIEGTITGGWYSIKLPNAIFNRLNENFSDLRLYSIVGSDSAEIPYLLKIRKDVVTDNVVELKVVNKNKREGRLYFTLELQAGQKANYLDLHFDQANYNAFITIEGSNDQKAWFELADKKRVLSIQNEVVDYSASTINFPTSSYTYLRVTTTADTPLDLVSASLKNKSTVKGIVNAVPLKWNVLQDAKVKQTVVTVMLTDQVPVTTLGMQIENDADYYRDFLLEYVTDSSQSPKGYTKFYSTLTEDYLTSINSNVFTFQQVVAKEFRLTVNNQDNLPLQIKAIEFLGPRVELVTKIKPGTGNIFLFYGNKTLESPSYDLTRFQENIPDTVLDLSLALEERVAKPIEKSAPLFSSKLWLWVIMGFMIAVLGFFTLRMVKNK